MAQVMVYFLPFASFPRAEFLRLQSFGSRVVGNAAVEGLSRLDVIQPVLLAFGDRCVAHHQLR